MLNRIALEAALEHLAAGPEHAALVELARSLADVVDVQTDRGVFDDKAWREYRQALRALMEATASGSSDGFDDWLKSLRAEVPNGADAES